MKLSIELKVLSVVACALFAVSCSGSDPAAPTPTCQDRTATNFGAPLPCTYPPPTPACETNHTGTLIVVNHAANLLPRDVYVDGANWGTLPYGSQFTREVAAGVPHPVECRDTATGRIVSTAQPNIAQCQAYTLTNTFSVDREVLD